jgi:hypothetical protein
MTRKTVLIGGALSALALGLASPALLADTTRGPGYAQEMSAMPAHFGGWRHGGHHGWRHGGGMRHLCGEGRDQRIDGFVELVESFVTFTPEQGEAWQGLVAAVRTSSASIDAACAELAGAGPPRTAADKLGRLETMLAKGLDVVQQVRPAFDTFYATLNDQQKQAIDDLASRRRRH